MEISFDPEKDAINQKKHGLSQKRTGGRSGDMAEDIDNPEWSDQNTRPLDYAAKLKVVRARLGLSQSAFAALLRIPRASLQNWEQRRTLPDAPARALIDLVYQDPHEIGARLKRSSAA
jgi:putative transcriptional regulator